MLSRLETYVCFYNRCRTGENQRPTQSNGLPQTTRSNGAVDLLELRPKGEVFTVQGAKEELPQLHTGNNRQDEVNDRVKTCTKLDMGSCAISINHLTYLLGQSQL